MADDDESRLIGGLIAILVLILVVAFIVIAYAAISQEPRPATPSEWVR